MTPCISPMFPCVSRCITLCFHAFPCVSPIFPAVFPVVFPCVSLCFPVFHLCFPVFSRVSLCFTCVSPSCIYLVMTPVCSEETGSITRSSKDDQSLRSISSRYRSNHKNQRNQWAPSAPGRRLRLRKSPSRPHARGLPLEEYAQIHKYTNTQMHNIQKLHHRLLPNEGKP